MTEHTSSAFEKDCLKLIKSFQSKNSLEFSSFCEEWKAMALHYIFSGFRNEIELIHNVNEYFLILKKLFIHSETLIDKIGLLYLMYSIYYKQPAKEFCKIRIQFEEWKVFKSFYEKLHPRSEFNQIKLIFMRLLSSGAFIFVETNYFLNFEYFMKREYEDEIETKNIFKMYSDVYEREEKMLLNENTGFVTSLQYIQDAYNEMKELLDTTPGPSTSSARTLPQTRIVNDVMDGFKNLTTIFEITPDNSSGSDSCSDEDEDMEHVKPPSSIRKRRLEIKNRALKWKQNRKEVQRKNKNIKQEINTSWDSVENLFDEEEDDSECNSKQNAKQEIRRINATLRDIKTNDGAVEKSGNLVKILLPKIHNVKFPSSKKSKIEKVLDGMEMDYEIDNGVENDESNTQSTIVPSRSVEIID